MFNQVCLQSSSYRPLISSTRAPTCRNIFSVATHTSLLNAFAKPPIFPPYRIKVAALLSRLYPASSAGLDDLAGVLVVGSQDWPSEPVRFRKRKLQLRAHDFESAFRRVDGAEQRHARTLSLLVRSVQVQFDGVLVLELHLADLLVDFLQVETRNNRCRRLVEVVPDLGKRFLSLLVLLLADEAMPGLGFAACNPHELFKV